MFSILVHPNGHSQIPARYHLSLPLDTLPTAICEEGAAKLHYEMGPVKATLGTTTASLLSSLLSFIMAQGGHDHVFGISSGGPRLPNAHGTWYHVRHVLHPIHCTRAMCNGCELLSH